MNIDRHNYEEYFILYLDNELNSEDRRMVEGFVQQHPDLKEELDTLLQFKLVPDTQIVFEGKEELMKEHGHSLITTTNYEEWLSLYVDNELNAEQKQLLDKFMATHPAALQELELLQRTKLQPEIIVFADKASLYRKEEKTRRIIPVRWRAAAAILILLLGATALIVSNNKNDADTSGVAATTPGQQKTVPVQNNTENRSIPEPEKENNNGIAAENKNIPSTSPLVAQVKNTDDTKQPATHPSNEKKQESVAVKKTVVPVNHSTDNTIKKEDAGVADINNKPSNNLPQPLNNPNTVIKNKPEDALAVNSQPVENNYNNNSSNPAVTSATGQPSDIVYASKVETLEETDGKKNKNRGIFRKIARTFEKRTNVDPTDDNRLLVAGLSIKLK